MMKNENIVIPLIALSALVLTSFVPVIQILLMHLNGAILYVVGKLIGSEADAIQYFVNSLFSLIVLVFFYKAKKTIWKIFSVIFSIIFLLPMITYSLYNLFDEDSYYLLPMLLSGLATGIVLIIIGILKKTIDL